MVDQKSFGHAVLDPNQPVPDGIIQPDGTAATKRFNVYRNNVVKSLIDALATAFPVINQLVGEKFFEAMAGHYVRLHPPSTPMMMFYGETFPHFLESFPPAQNLPYLADVARVEHARRIAYHAADDPIAPPDALADIPAETVGQITLTLHRSVQIIRSPHPVFSIWRFNATDDKTPITSQAEDVLIARPEADVEMRQLPLGGAQFLSALQAGEPLEDAATHSHNNHTRI